MAATVLTAARVMPLVWCMHTQYIAMKNVTSLNVNTCMHMTVKRGAQTLVARTGSAKPSVSIIGVSTRKDAVPTCNRHRPRQRISIFIDSTPA